MNKIRNIPTKTFIFDSMKTVVNKFGVHEIVINKPIQCEDTYRCFRHETFGFDEYTDKNKNQNKSIIKYIKKFDNLEHEKFDMMKLKILILNYAFPIIQMRKDSNIIIDNKIVWKYQDISTKQLSDMQHIHNFENIEPIKQEFIIDVPKKYVNFFFHKHSNLLQNGLVFDSYPYYNNICSNNSDIYNIKQYAPGGIDKLGEYHDGSQYERFFNRNMTLIIRISPGINMECTQKEIPCVIFPNFVNPSTYDEVIVLPKNDNNKIDDIYKEQRYELLDFFGVEYLFV